MYRFLATTVLLAFLLSPMVSAQEFFPPAEYLAFDHPIAGSAVSPFRGLEFDFFHIEDFDDGALSTPGVSVREFTNEITTAFSDSVDGDDGTVDGFASGSSSSLFTNFATSTLTFDFDSNAFGGQFPTHVGIVWTDVGRNGGGTPAAEDLINNTTFEAFDSDGNSLGLFGPFSFGDDSISRTTAEDRFLGFANPDGISSFQISMPGLDNWEVDHLQYGGSSPVLGDVDGDQTVNFQDISPFIAVLSAGEYQEEADIDQNGEVNFFDIAAFIAILAAA